MLKALRDWLRTQSTLSGLDIAIHGDITQGKFPRARLRCSEDQRFDDLDGEAAIRQQSIQIDVYEKKGQIARQWSDSIEDVLPSLRQTTYGGWAFTDTQSNGATDGPPEASPDGDDEPLNRVTLDILLTGSET